MRLQLIAQRLDTLKPPPNQVVQLNLTIRLSYVKTPVGTAVDVPLTYPRQLDLSQPPIHNKPLSLQYIICFVHIFFCDFFIFYHFHINTGQIFMCKSIFFLLSQTISCHSIAMIIVIANNI